MLAGYHLLVVPPDMSAEDYVVGALVREAYAPLWEGKAPPEWFVDGLAEFYAPSPKNVLLPPVQQAARDGTLLSLSEMETAQAQPSALWRAQSFGMILYIADTIGFPGLFDLARVDAGDFDAAYGQAMPISPDALIPAWQQWIFSRNAEAVYGLTPYQPPTPTPSVTPTPSDTPLPSATPTASPTLTLTPSTTPTPSNTPRGYVGTYTPPPTVTPSPTDTPAPATITPLPPGSLPTITPTPTPLEAAVAQPTVQAGAITFLVLLLGLLVFLFIRLGNRR